jgi:hypothetical protein
MELKVDEIQLPEKILFNYKELKAELTEKVEIYKNLVYTEQEIKQAKADKASLNKLKKALNDERIRREKEYMAPFNTFKKQINEIIAIIDEPVAIIDSQVKEYEEKRRDEKRADIAELYEKKESPAWLELEKIWSDKWLNISTSMKSIEAEIEERLDQIQKDIEIINELPEFAFEAAQEYRRTLDLNRAISEGKRLADIQKKKQEAEARAKAEQEEKARAQEEIKKTEETAQEDEIPGQTKVEDFIQSISEEPKEEPKQWVKFQALLTVSQAIELKEFFETRKIEFKRA